MTTDIKEEMLGLFWNPNSHLTMMVSFSVNGIYLEYLSQKNLDSNSFVLFEFKFIPHHK